MNTPNALALAQFQRAILTAADFARSPRPPLTPYSRHHLHTHPPTRAATAGRGFSVVGALALARDFLPK